MSDRQTPSSEPAQPQVRSSALHAFAGRFDPWILAAILLGMLVRCWAFGAVPSGLHQDEASAGYDAFALLHYGIDRNGFHNPVAFVGWGSGMFASVSYAAIPFIALLGLTPLAVRLPELLLGMASLGLFAYTVRRIDGRETARVATFFLAICPWHIVISRWALDSNLLPGVLLLGAALLVASLRDARWLPLAFAAWGLAFYAYGTAYIAVPCLLALFVAYGLYHRVWPLRWVASGTIVFAIVSLPALAYVAVNVLRWDSIVTPLFSIPRLPGVPRYETVGNFQFWTAAFYRAAAQHLAGAGWVLVRQSDGNIWNSVPWFGLIYLFTLPLTLVGLVQLARQCWSRTFQPAMLLACWCVAALVVALFVEPNINRLNVALFPLVYCTALGIDVLRKHLRPLYFVTAGTYACSFAAFVWAYFFIYPAQSSQAFNDQLIETIRLASATPEGRICITNQVMFPYIYALFATREDPHAFLQTVKYANQGDEFQHVASYGRYIFGLPHFEDPTVRAYIVLPTDGFFGPDAFTIEKHGSFDLVRPR